MTSLVNDFKDFLSSNDILVTIIATILSSHISSVSDSLMKNIIMPLVNIDLNGDGKPDRDNLEDITFHFCGVELKIGKFLLTLLEFLIILMIIFAINSVAGQSKNIPL